MPACRARASSPPLTTSAPAPGREHRQHGDVIVGLHRVMDGHFRHGRPQIGQPAAQGVTAEHPAGCAVFAGDAGQANAVQQKAIQRVDPKARPARD